MELTEKINIVQIKSNSKEEKEDLIIRELPLTIIINGREVVTLMCTPYNIEHLTAGFLMSEGFIACRGEVKSITIGKDSSYVNVELAGDVEIDKDVFQKRFISSGCGRGAYFYDTRDGMGCKSLDSGLRIRSGDVSCLMKEFNNRSLLFKTTGGAHSAALASPGLIEVFAEDIGRHNAVDKIFGKCLLDNISTKDKVVLTSGRLSSEIIIKIVKSRVSVVVSRSAPTGLAVKLAEKLNLTLVGFARGVRMNIYTHSERVL